MSLQLLRGTTAQRNAYTPSIGELVFDLTEQALYIGDGTTLGGLLVNGLKFSGISHNHVASDTTDLTEAIQDRLNSALVAGANMSIVYDDNANTFTFTPTGGSGVTTEQANQIKVSRLSSESGYAQFINEFCETASAATIYAEIDPTNIYSSLHAHIVRNRISRAVAQGNNSTSIHRNGCDEIWPEGTLTARAIAATSDITRSRRIGIISPALTTSVCGLYHSNAGGFIGNGTSGGFTFYAKFMISDASLVTTARMFVGVSSNVSVPTNTDPAAMFNSIGFGRGNTQNTMQLYYGGSATQASIDLGANFPVNTASTDIYEIGLFAFPKLANKVGYFVKRTLTGQTAHGILSAATAGVQLPNNTTALSLFRAFRSTNGTATAVALDLFEMMQGYNG